MTTNIADALGVSLGGVAQKRGLIPRVPDGERLLADAAVWLTGEYPDAVRSTHQHTTGEGDAALSVDLHPAAPPFALTANDDGRVTAAAETGVAGPGYHRFIGRVLERLGAELAIDWTDGDGAAAFADRQGAEQLYLGWLGPQLAKARVRVRRGERGVSLGMPEGTRVTTEAALATVLGPRDEAWLDAAIGDPRVALSVTPWWADATDGLYLLNRALVLMWLHVRWRTPAMEGEADLFDEVHRLLSRAYPFDPDLDFPWHAWTELAALRGIDRPDGAPGGEPGDDHARTGSTGRIPARSGRDQPRRLGPGGPRFVRRAAFGGGVVGRRHRPEHHVGRNRHGTS